MTQTWNIDVAHSHVAFSVRHMVIAKVRGQFTKFAGAIQSEGDSFKTFSANIETASIETGVGDRDKHLKSADFFDAEKHPSITFASKSISQNGSELKVTGDLSIHGVTKEVVLTGEYSGQGKDPWGNTRAAFQARTAIERKDFGLSWNQALEAGGLLVGEKVDIEIDVEAILAK